MSQKLNKEWRGAAKRAETTASALRALLWVVLLSGVVLSLAPFYLMIVMSLKTPGEIASTTVWDWPRVLQWSNYEKVLTNQNAPFFMFLRNSMIVAGMSTIGVLLSASMVAYGFARIKVPGRDRLFVVLLSTMILPQHILRNHGYD